MDYGAGWVFLNDDLVEVVRGGNWDKAWRNFNQYLANIDLDGYYTVSQGGTELIRGCRRKR